MTKAELDERSRAIEAAREEGWREGMIAAMRASVRAGEGVLAAFADKDDDLYRGVKAAIEGVTGAARKMLGKLTAKSGGGS